MSAKIIPIKNKIRISIVGIILFTALSFADLEGGFFSISSDDGVKAFLLTTLKETPLRLFNGKYLETLFVDEILLKKDLHLSLIHI